MPLLSKKEIKILTENLFSLTMLQGLTYLFPLITLPYLTRILGPAKYGMIAFAQSFVSYFGILVNFGFDLSASREISIYRDSPKKVSGILSAVTLIRIGMTLISFVIVTIIIFAFDKFRKDYLLYYFTFAGILGTILSPTWFFQGMEKMRYITILNVVARSIFLVAIFIFVRKASDYLYVPLIGSIGVIVAGIIAQWVILRDFKVKYVVPSIDEIIHQLKEGGYIFISRVSISFYTISNIFFLGLLTSDTVVGVYAAADKLINALKGLSGIFLITAYPFIARVVKESKKRALKLVGLEIKLLGGLEFLGALVFYFLAFYIVRLFFGAKFDASIPLVRILIFIVPVVLVSSIIGQQLLLNFNMKRLFTLSIVYFSIVHIILLPFTVHWGGAMGAAYTVLFTESAIMLYKILGLRRERKDIFSAVFLGKDVGIKE